MKKLIALAAVATILASCSNDEDVLASQESVKDTPISIQSAGVGELTSRAIVDNKLVSNSDRDATLGIFITGGSAEKYKVDNMKWKHKGSSWSNESGNVVLFEGAGTAQKICAYSPYDANADYSDGVTVTATDQIDWLVATDKELTTASVTLTMTHAMTKLVLEPTYGTEVTDQKIAKVDVGGMYASGKLRFYNNKWQDLSAEKTTITKTDGYELLVIPMDNIDSFPITITMGDGRVFKTDVSLTSVGSKLEAAKQYNIKLQIGQDKVTLDNISAAPWTTINGDNLETE